MSQRGKKPSCESPANTWQHAHTHTHTQLQTHLHLEVIGLLEWNHWAVVCGPLWVCSLLDRSAVMWSVYRAGSGLLCCLPLLSAPLDFLNIAKVFHKCQRDPLSQRRGWNRLCSLVSFQFSEGFLSPKPFFFCLMATWDLVVNCSLRWCSYQTAEWTFRLSKLYPKHAV